MAIPVVAENYISVTSIPQLQQILQSKMYVPPLHILGGGSNIVFTKDVSGTLLNINIKGISEHIISDNEVHVTAQAGETWQNLVDYALERNYGGIENLTLIPGKTGAAPMQNIGAYGVELQDVLHNLTAIDRENGEMRVFSTAECELGYRDSVFKNRYKDCYIITSITLSLTRMDHKLHLDYGAIQEKLASMQITRPSIADVSEAVAAIRRSKLPDPKNIPNCGSFFKNPLVNLVDFQPILQKYPGIPYFPIHEVQVKIPAAWLIEQAGWKGFRNSNVGVHDQQSLVLINHHNGTGQQIYDLSEEIKRSVAEKFGIVLEREVNII